MKPLLFLKALPAPRPHVSFHGFHGSGASPLAFALREDSPHRVLTFWKLQLSCAQPRLAVLTDKGLLSPEVNPQHRSPGEGLIRAPVPPGPLSTPPPPHPPAPPAPPPPNTWLASRVSPQPQLCASHHLAREKVSLILPSCLLCFSVFMFEKADKLPILLFQGGKKCDKGWAAELTPLARVARS